MSSRTPAGVVRGEEVAFALGAVLEHAPGLFGTREVLGLKGIRDHQPVGHRLAEGLRHSHGHLGEGQGLSGDTHDGADGAPPQDRQRGVPDVLNGDAREPAGIHQEQQS
ncbi:hypothetical protein [Kitasatospora sp. NPDC058190]|uniref:hypothetical protein n=1 Tax=Kitasatospora sp. NPDC058190 TaxID=3346371 RepID=UPI0036D94477